MGRYKMYKNKKIAIYVLAVVSTFLLVFPKIESYGYGETNKEIAVVEKEANGNEEKESIQASGENGLNENTLHARSAVLMDGESGRILYSKQGEQVMPMASTTKIMTCIVALENGNLDDIYETSSYASSMPKVRLGAKTGEKFTLKDLLYSLMLESHNDSAVVIAEGVAGSVEAFTHLMNEKAKELGCNHTNFVTPNGLDADNHFTTAEELAKIMRYCILDSEKKEEFLAITRTSSYQFMDVEKKRSFSCNNHNALLTMMNGAISGKTGFTGKAGYCYVGAVEKEDKLFIGVVLASGWPPNKTYKWNDMTKLIAYGVDNFEKKQIAKITTPNPIPVIDGKEDTLELFVEEKILETLVKNEDKVTQKITIPDSIKAPVEKGQQIGEIQTFINDTLYDATPIVATKTIEVIDFSFCFEQLIRLFLP